MVELSGGAGVVLESRDEGWVDQQLRVQYLERHAAPQHGILRQIHRCEAAAAQLTHDRIFPERLLCIECRHPFAPCCRPHTKRTSRSRTPYTDKRSAGRKWGDRPCDAAASVLG